MTNQFQKNNNNFITGEMIHACKNELFKLEQTGNPKTLCVSHIKRFMERWTADPNFREQVSAEPYKAIVRYGLKIDPEEIRLLWDLKFAKELSAGDTISASLKCWQEFADENRVGELLKSIAASSSEPRFKAWWERQIARTTSQFKKWLQDALVHAPVCFELSKGCSIQCWFCGVSAARLSNNFTYNQENAKLWHEVLELMKEILGPAASAGFCYWATDPFDNPDYEKFCSDFHEVLGMFPQTTTAQPMKDPVRTRALLKLSREKGCPLNRFSILSLKMLNQVHEEFSAEELAFVNLALQNEGANKIKANAGRLRERNLKKGKEDSESPEQGTIACVTGFLFNMVDRSVKLISPCNADERWPLGYMVYDEGTFSNANDLKILLERMISNNMPLAVRPNALINFRHDLKYESLDDGFQVSTKFKTFKFRHAPYLKELGEVVRKGGKTAEEIACIFENNGVSTAHTFHNFNLMFERGILDDEPKPKPSEVLV